MRRDLRGAWKKLTRHLFLGQWSSNLLLMVLAAVWLQIPDSHSWQFALSMLSGLSLVIACGWLYTVTFFHLRVCTPRPPHWRSWLLLAVVIAIWWLGLQPLAAARAHESLFAGYWNSQSPPWLRHRLGYSQLIAWQEHIYDGFEYLWAGLLLPLAVEVCACGLRSGWLQRAGIILRHGLYWLCVLVFGFAASSITWALAGWAPALGLTGQTVSVVVRLGVAYTIDMALWCYLLALVAHYYDREHEPE